MRGRLPAVAAGIGLAALLALPAPALAYRYCDPAQALERGRANEQWFKALRERRFAELDRHYNGVLQDLREGRISDAEAEYAFSPFTWTANIQPSAFQDWIAAHPDSEAARLAQGFFHVMRGWQARGTDYAPKTAATQFSAMREAFDEAAKALAEAEKRSKRPALVWSKRIDMRKAQHGHAAVRELYQAAIQRDPRSVAARREFLEASLPQWGGSWAEAEGVVDGANALAEGDRRYLRARLDFERGLGAWRDKDLKKASDLYERALKACPALPNLAHQARWHYGQTRELDRLVFAATREIERFPAKGEVYSARGWAYGTMGKEREAFADYQRAAQFGHARGFYMLGMFHEFGRAGAPLDARKALEYYTAAHERGDPEAKARVDALRARLGIR